MPQKITISRLPSRLCYKLVLDMGDYDDVVRVDGIFWAILNEMASNTEEKFQFKLKNSRD